LISDSVGMTGQKERVASHRPAVDAQDSSDWAWEFLRRNSAYRRDWRASVPRHLPVVTLRDGTRLLRLRRRYPRAERWGLYAFADPSKTLCEEPVFWLPGTYGRLLRARAVTTKQPETGGDAPLAAFAVNRNAAIGADGIAVVTLKGQGQYVALELHDLAVLTWPATATDRVDDRCPRNFATVSAASQTGGSDRR
jgi:hypothetical protein